MKTVAMVLFPDFLLLDMAGPMEVFSIANRYLKPEDHYQLTTLGAVPGAVSYTHLTLPTKRIV